MKTIGILVFDDVEELDFAGPLEVFARASLSVDLKVLTVAETPNEIRCRYGLRMIPSCSFRDCPPLNLLIVPGGPGARNHARCSPPILEFVRQQQGFVASVCTGALILAGAGLLKNQVATTHHNRFDLLREYEGVSVKENVRMVIGKRVATSAGVSAGIDLALALLKKFWGEKVALSVAENLEWESRSWRTVRAGSRRLRAAP